jgi:hypothetical protein
MHESESPAEAEIPRESAQSLPALRAFARIPEKVSALPHLFP